MLRQIPMNPIRFYDKFRNHVFYSTNYVLKNAGMHNYLISVSPMYGNRVAKIIKKVQYKKIKLEKEESIKMDPNTIINKIMGGKTGKVTRPKLGNVSINRNMRTKEYIKTFGPKGDIDKDGVLNFKDCRPLDPTRDMVHYGYYKGIKEDGTIDYVYAGSKIGVRRIGEDKKPPIHYVKIEEMTYEEAHKKLGEEGLVKSRQSVSGYTSSGKIGGRAAFEPRAPK